MAAKQSNDKQLLCNMAIDDVVDNISIKFPQYPSFGEKFKANCVEEEIEEIEVLIDDVAEGFDESVILESVFEDIEIKQDDKEPLCTAIYCILQTFCPPPTSLNLVEIATKVERKELDKMKETVSKQAQLFNLLYCKNESIVKLLLIGENNHFPIFTYLIDTYSRYRLLEYQKLYKQLSQIDQKKRKKFVAKKFRSVMELSDFFKECHAMRMIAKKAKDDADSERALLLYDASMKSVFRRFCGPIKMKPIQISHKINDSLFIFAKYYIGILCAVNKILQSSNSKLPQQIDFCVIPKAMTTTNEFTDDDDENDEYDEDDSYIDVDEDDDETETETDIINLNELLKSTDNLVIKDIADNLEISNLSQTFFQIYEDVVKGKRSKRMVMIIDRRIDGKNVIENDKNYCKLSADNKVCQHTLYAFLPANTQNIPNGHYLHESMWNLSRIEVLPSSNGNINDSLNMFLLSIHVHSENVVRSYWYHDNWSFTRFFVNDMVNILPLYFVEKDLKRDKDKAAKYQDIVEIIDLINEHSNDLPLKDSHFDTFFEENTKIKPSMAYSGRFMKFKILIFGYIRDIYEKEEKLLPIEMINLCYKYYVEPFEMMQWTSTPIYYFEIN